MGERVRKDFGTITDGKVQRLKPPPKPPTPEEVAAGAKRLPNEESHWHRLDTGNSLGVSVSYGGTKTWRIRFNDGDGKPRTVKLGVFALGHADHLDAKAAVAKALDPEKWKPKPVEVEGDALPFDPVSKVARRWLVEVVETDRHRTAKEKRRLVERHVIPAWGDRSIGTLKRSDVAALLSKVVETAARSKNASVGGRVMGNKVRNLVSAMMNWWVGVGGSDDFIPPIHKAQLPDKRKLKARDRMLDNQQDRKLKDWRELGALWAVTETKTPFNGLVRILLLTGQRLDKVRTMKRADISDDGVWTLPVEDKEREKGNIGAVQLPPLALQVIDDMPRVEGNPYVFPAVGGRGPVRASTSERARLAKKLKAVLPEMKPFVLHDLRHTMRTLLTDELHVDGDIAEAVIGHKLRGVRGVYDHSTHFERKSAALQAFANLIEHIVHEPTEGGNVVPLRERSA